MGVPMNFQRTDRMRSYTGVPKRHASVAGCVRLLRLCSAIVVLAAFARSSFAESYYVDCDQATDGNGSLDAPWNNLTTPSTRTFLAGDVISLKRRTTCAGMLAPQGSGDAGAPIAIGAYGTGPRPVIAGTSIAAIRLFNQSYWAIRDVETIGGNPHGIHVSGNAAATLRYFRISNVSVHDVAGVATTKQSGLIEISPEGGSPAIIDDVIVDGATVFNTEQWKGIHVGCANGIFPPSNAGPIIIRNSRASNIAGDGITIYACSNGLIENNVAYDIGLASSAAVGTPNAIWTWACADCVVQFNEGFRAHSPERDGGIFDIDWGSSNTTVQYNYGHDADGYCVGIFGAWNLITTNSIVRYNVCANNGRADPYLQGDIYLKTWDGGSLDGVEIYNNTIYWNPAVPTAALLNRENSLVGIRPRFFKNNIIYSSNTPFISTDANLVLDNNLYWINNGVPRWDFGTGSWNSLASFQSGTGQEKQGLFADPLLAAQTSPFESLSLSGFKLLPNSPAIDRGALISATEGRDFFGVTVPQGARVDIGASEYEAALWTFCAPEGGVCGFTGTTEVRYGANGSYVYQTLTDGTACTNDVFGDPIYGTVKECAIKSTPPPTDWTFCAPEGGVCAFTGTTEVRYGANGSYVYPDVDRRHRVYQRGVRRSDLRGREELRTENRLRLVTAALVS